MNYQLLTINNITKICDDKYYFKPFNTLTEIQWYDHQIDFIIENLDIDISLKVTNPITGYRLSRSQIFILLLKTFNTNNFTLKSSIPSTRLKQFGLFKPDNLPKDIYTFDNLGGYSHPPIEYNHRSRDIVIPDKYVYGKVVEFSKINKPSKIKNTKESY